MNLRILTSSAILVLALVGCQTSDRLILEREFPSNLGEPVYLLKPSNFPMSDMMAVWMPRQPPPSKDRAMVTVSAIGPKDTTPPMITKASRSLLRKIVADLPSNLPNRAIFLVSGSGGVVEAAFTRSRNKLNERVFAARLRALEFAPATYGGKPVAVICEIDLATGAVEPNKAPEPTTTSVTGAVGFLSVLQKTAGN